MKSYLYVSIIILCCLLSACYSPKVLTNKGFNPTSVETDTVLAQIPTGFERLSTVKGEGKAIVSEPKNSSHINLDFASTRQKSLITIQNRLGIEGGKILSTPDSLVIYNQIDEFARIVPVGMGSYSRVNNLASVNILDILTVPVSLNEAEKILENKELYLVILPSGTKVYIDKQNFRVQQIDQSQFSRAPYSRIIYDAYTEIKGFSIPRRITIFSADGRSRVSLLIQGLDINPVLGDLKIDLPDDIPIYRQ